MSNLLKYNVSLPRYTSYPPAPSWNPLDEDIYRKKLEEMDETTPLSLYFHIPFCATMCLFCACSVILNRNPENEVEYVDYLMREIDLVQSILRKKRKVLQLHFGGGTPTKLSSALLERLFSKIASSFEIDFSGEIAIEIDPRTVFQDQGAKLCFLKSLGFNRVSFGVQDTNERVQEAIRRRQSKEMTLQTFYLAKELGFTEINCDLIYGLPFQTKETFSQTVEEMLGMRPDRIALFSYAKVPWLKGHQRAIPDEALPSTLEKFTIYENARAKFIEAGYIAIGMDHFALPSSELAQSYHSKALHRNFQGYTCLPSDHLIAFGVTAIGSLPGLFVQNHKEISLWKESIENGHLPILRGKILNEDDEIRKWTIHQIMCRFQVDKIEFLHRFGVNFDHYFRSVDFSDVQDLVINTEEKLVVSQMGELFVRNVAVLFDTYYKHNTAAFSKAI